MRSALSKAFGQAQELRNGTEAMSTFPDNRSWSKSQDAILSPPHEHLTLHTQLQDVYQHGLILDPPSHNELLEIHGLIHTDIR